MEKQIVINQLNTVFDFKDTRGKIKACGRDACMDLIYDLTLYCNEHDIKLSQDYFGNFKYGMLNIENILDFNDKYLK